MDSSGPSTACTDSLVPLLAKLPWELLVLVRAYAYVFQMQDKYCVNDLDEMARRVCGFRQEITTIHQWLMALLDLDVHIPDPQYTVFVSSIVVPSQMDPKNYQRRHQSYGWTVFHVAARAGDAHLIRRLIRLGYDINALSSGGTTAVSDLVGRMSCECCPHSEGICQSLSVLQTLCEEGCDVNFTYKRLAHSTDDYTIGRLVGSGAPLGTIIPALKLLLARGAVVNQSLLAVAETKTIAYTPIISMLVKAGANVEELDNRGMTPLAVAASMNNSGMVQALLDAGANAKCHGRSPLFAALGNSLGNCTPSTTTMVKALCKAGADVTVFGPLNHTLLSSTMTLPSIVQRADYETVPILVKLLCESGADVNFVHYRIPYHNIEADDTPLHIAARMVVGEEPWVDETAPPECIKTLISYGARVDSRNGMGQTPLHLAVLKQDLLSVKILCRHGASVDVEDNLGQTALMLAATVKLGDKEDCHGEILAVLERRRRRQQGVMSLHLPCYTQ